MSYGQIWWQDNQADLQRFDHLQVFDLGAENLKPLAENLSRAMSLQCTLQEGKIWLGDENMSCELDLRQLK